ncbi:MAG: N-acetylneuraminate synthase family protein [Candidatus Hodarchaeota archaeon]
MEFKIKNKYIGDGHPTFIIAEIGANHNGSIKIAKKLIDEAKSAGVDAVKVQTWQAEKFISQKNDSEQWLDADFLKKYEFKLEWIEEIIHYCEKKDLIFFSTPADYEDCEELEKYGVPLYKWGGVQITDHPKLKYIASKGKPIILSTGGSTYKEIDEAIEVIKSTGNDKIILLQCTTSYPCDIDKVDLQVITAFKKKYPYPIGYSGHTMSIYPPIGSILYGACVVEKHITLNRNFEGPDHMFAMEPGEFKMIVEGIRTLEKAMGKKEKCVYEVEKKIIEQGRRSIIASKDIKKNMILTPDMLDTARPGTGIRPTLENFEKIIPGKKALVDIKEREMLKWEMLDD